MRLSSLSVDTDRRRPPYSDGAASLVPPAPKKKIRDMLFLSIPFVPGNGSMETGSGGRMWTNVGSLGKLAVGLPVHSQESCFFELIIPAAMGQ